MSSRRTHLVCKHLLVCLIAFACFTKPVKTEVNGRATSCTTDQTIIGYTSIIDINADQEDEISNIETNGGNFSSSYVFVLCPDSTFSTENTPLKVYLSNSMFICGDDGSSANKCIIENGPVQVEIFDSSIDGYAFIETTLEGITFSGFSEKSISASAGENTKISFLDVIWQNFNNSTYIIRQQNDNGKAMTIIIDTAIITNGNGGDLISNDGGIILISNLLVSDISATAILAVGNNGSSDLKDSRFTSSTVNEITSTSGSSTQNIANVVVTQMNGIGNSAFFITGQESSLVAESIQIINNEVIKSFVKAIEGSDALISTSNFTSNGGINFAFDSRSFSNLTVSNAEISGNVKESPRTLSAILYADGGQITGSDVILSDNGVLVQIFGKNNGEWKLIRTCINSGEGSVVAFVSKDSRYSISSVYVDPSINVNVVSCNKDDERYISVESPTDPTTGCFDNADNCIFECEILKDVDSCGETAMPTISLSSLPSRIRSGMPTPSTLTNNPTRISELFPGSNQPSISSSPAILSPSPPSLYLPQTPSVLPIKLEPFQIQIMSSDGKKYYIFSKGDLISKWFIFDSEHSNTLEKWNEIGKYREWNPSLDDEDEYREWNPSLDDENKYREWNPSLDDDEEYIEYDSSLDVKDIYREWNINTASEKEYREGDRSKAIALDGPAQEENRGESEEYVKKTFPRGGQFTKEVKRRKPKRPNTFLVGEKSTSMGRKGAPSRPSVPKRYAKDTSIAVDLKPIVKDAFHSSATNYLDEELTSYVNHSFRKRNPGHQNTFRDRNAIVANRPKVNEILMRGKGENRGRMLKRKGSYSESIRSRRTDRKR